MTLSRRALFSGLVAGLTGVTMLAATAARAETDEERRHREAEEHRHAAAAHRHHVEAAHAHHETVVHKKVIEKHEEVHTDH